jgi:hypothetical protein
MCSTDPRLPECNNEEKRQEQQHNESFISLKQHHYEPLLVSLSL